MGLKTNDRYLKPTIDALSPQVMAALANAAARLTSGAGSMASLRWFGTAAVADRTRLARKLRTMRSVINVNSITIGFADYAGAGAMNSPVARDANTNAMSLAVNAPVGIGGNVATLGAAMGGGNQDQRSVFLDENFMQLPDLLPLAPPPPPVVPANGAPVPPPPPPRVAANGWHQSKFNTLVHELTHLLLGTDDVVGATGDAYGTQRASQLAAANAGQAENNAENWGIFVEACGHRNIR
ncbi:MAG: M35 family metallo-endopeptidase [Erythrobacter sp.]|nr:M35 family metallo-endopeptidase [Erythrobacter sp.]